VVTRLSAAGQEDSEAHSAAGSIVFRSRRDGNGEIYIGDAALEGQQRLTEDPWDDAEPALSPSGDAVLFVSNRSGTPRLWVMVADGGNQRMVATGSSTFIPERAPAWRPSGDQIAFTSTRTGTSQVFVMPVAGGEAVQVTHEATGAFLPSWSSDGSWLIYTTLEGGSTVRMVPRGGGAWRSLASGGDAISDAACSGRWCIAVAGVPGFAAGDIVSVSRIGRAPQPVVADTPDSREPAFLVR
jgi:Tol biopolymer transport system component